MTDNPPLRGRQAEAARNDEVILAAAQDVYVRDPTAPISAVAEAAGVGVGGIYRRYAGKDELLRAVCARGLRTYIEIAETALAGAGGAWEAFATFVTGIVDADVHSLTVQLAGSFTPTDELYQLSQEADRLSRQLLDQVRAAHRVRADFHRNDLTMLLEQLAAVRVEDADRTRTLRRRYLSLHLDGLRPGAVTETLPGSPPTDDELSARWRT